MDEREKRGKRGRRDIATGRSGRKDSTHIREDKKRR